MNAKSKSEEIKLKAAIFGLERECGLWQTISENGDFAKKCESRIKRSQSFSGGIDVRDFIIGRPHTPVAVVSQFGEFPKAIEGCKFGEVKERNRPRVRYWGP